MEPNKTENNRGPAQETQAPESKEPVSQQPPAQPEAPQEEALQPEAAPQQAPQAPAPAPGKAPVKKEKKPFNWNKFKRGGMATALSVVFIAIVVALNLLVSALTDRFPSLDIDLTAQKVNSLSDQALEIAKNVDREVTIYLIGTQEGYEQNQIYSSYVQRGMQYSQVSSLVKRLVEANPLISMEYVDPDTNPEFISQYESDSLATGKVLVESDLRHTVLTVDDLFIINQETGSTINSKVDSALAGALELVNMDTVPVMSIITGHGEMLSTSNMAAFVDNMEQNNFQVEEVDILTQEIPENTQVLMIATPTTDFSTEEIDKIRAYLDDETRDQQVTLLVSAYPSQGELPNLAAFLEEWGVQVGTGVVAETDSNYAAYDARGVLVTASPLVLTSNTYSRLLSYYSAPITLTFEENNGISTTPLWTTQASAYVITADMTEEDAANPETGEQVVASLSSKDVEVNGETYARNVVVFGSSDLFTDNFMGTSAFEDSTYMNDLLLDLTDTDASAVVTVEEEEVETMQLDVSASTGTVSLLGILFTGGIPVVILLVGLGIYLKRRHL